MTDSPNAGKGKGIIRGALRKLINAELAKSPRIAVIGTTGVGKSTTINAIFNSGLPTNHVTACTQEATELQIPLDENGLPLIKIEDHKNPKGTIRIFDMPGLGESIAKDVQHRETYLRVLPHCEIALWVLKADSRELSSAQMAIRDIVGPAMGGLNRLVIGINQIDKMEPGPWNDGDNIPNPEQAINIDRKMDDVFEKLSTIIPDLGFDRVVPYSATKHFQLTRLYNALMEAMPDNRGWVLDGRTDIAEYIQPNWARASDPDHG